MKRKSWAGKIAKLAAANSCVRGAWYGVKWNGMVWLVEFGIVWCGVKGMVWNDMIRVVLCRMILYGMVW